MPALAALLAARAARAARTALAAAAPALAPAAPAASPAATTPQEAKGPSGQGGRQPTAARRRGWHRGFILPSFLPAGRPPARRRGAAHGYDD